MVLHLHIFVRSLKPDRKCTTATLGIGTAYIYHSVGRLQVSARLPLEAKLWNSLQDDFQSITNLDIFKVKDETAVFKGKNLWHGAVLFTVPVDL